MLSLSPSSRSLPFHFTIWQSILEPIQHCCKKSHHISSPSSFRARFYPSFCLYLPASTQRDAIMRLASISLSPTISANNSSIANDHSNHVDEDDDDDEVTFVSESLAKPVRNRINTSFTPSPDKNVSASPSKLSPRSRTASATPASLSGVSFSPSQKSSCDDERKRKKKKRGKETEKRKRKKNEGLSKRGSGELQRGDGDEDQDQDKDTDSEDHDKRCVSEELAVGASDQRETPLVSSSSFFSSLSSPSKKVCTPSLHPKSPQRCVIILHSSWDRLSTSFLRLSCLLWTVNWTL